MRAQSTPAGAGQNLTGGLILAAKRHITGRCFYITPLLFCILDVFGECGSVEVSLLAWDSSVLDVIKGIVRKGEIKDTGPLIVSRASPASVLFLFQLQLEFCFCGVA